MFRATTGGLVPLRELGWYVLTVTRRAPKSRLAVAVTSPCRLVLRPTGPPC